MKNNISLTLVSDFESDIKGALALIYSVKINTDIKYINILTNKSKEHKIIKLLSKVMDFFELEYKIFDLNEISDFKNIKNNNENNYKSLKHISKMAYSKVFIFSLVKEKTLYLDTDTLIVRKLKTKKLLKMDQSVYFVKNGEHSPSYWLKRYEDIFSSKKEIVNYAFNSGVIFKNFYSEDNNFEIYDNLLNSFRENNFTYLDQAHFNYVFKRKASFLKLKYNFPVHNSENKIVIKEKNPIILHFASRKKPWNSSDDYNPFFKTWEVYWNNLNDIFDLDI